MYNEEELYKETKEMIGDKANKKVPFDEHFNESTYRLGFSAKRQDNVLAWINGKSIALSSDYSKGEIKFLQNCSYDVAVVII